VAGRRNSTAGRRTAGWLAASKLYYAVTDVRLTKKMLSPRVWPQEVPAVCLEIQKDCKSAVRFIARRRHELHTNGEHALVRRIEIVDAQEQPDATSELLPYDACLLVPIGAREENACLAAIGTNDDQRFDRPSLVSDGVSSTKLNCRPSTKKRIAASWSRTTSATSSRCDIANQITPA
jgi:hypothetical protein